MNGQHAVRMASSAAGILLVLSGCVVHASPNKFALWQIAELCETSTLSENDPRHCDEVHDGKDGGPKYVIKETNDDDPNKHYLLIPGTPVVGIEDPSLRGAGVPDYWARAWDAREKLAQLKHGTTEIPRTAVALIVNSAVGRSQAQLHIHITCPTKQTRDAIAKIDANRARTEWMSIPPGDLPHPYRVRFVKSEGLDGVRPFDLVAAQGKSVAEDMADQTIVVIGASLTGLGEGFFILSDRVDATVGDEAWGEELADHSCTEALQK